MSYSLGLCEYRSQVVVVARFYPLNLTCIHILLILQEYWVVNRVKRHIVEHLSTLHHQVLCTHLQVIITGLQLLHGYNSLTTLLHSKEVNHR